MSTEEILELVRIWMDNDPSAFDQYCGKLKVYRKEGQQTMICIGSLQQNVCKPLNPLYLNGAGKQLVWIFPEEIDGKKYVRGRVLYDTEPKAQRINIKQNYIDFFPEWIKPKYFFSLEAREIVQLQVEENGAFVQFDLIVMLYEHVIKAFDAAEEKKAFWSNIFITEREAFETVQMASEDESVRAADRFQKALDVLVHVASTARVDERVKQKLEQAASARV